LTQATKNATKTTDTENMFRTIGYNGYGFNMKTRTRLYGQFIRPRLEYGVQLKTLEWAQHKMVPVERELFDELSGTAISTVGGLILVELVRIVQAAEESVVFISDSGGLFHI
jgi:hypothetical protein